MATTSKINKSKLVDFYMNEALEKNRLPKNVYSFCEKNKIEEQEFYAHFNNLNSLEAYIFELFYENTTKLLYANESFAAFSAQDKVLSFYYTFFELLTANRSFVLLSLKNKNIFSKIILFRDLKEQYLHFINSLDIEFIDIPVEKLASLKDKTLGYASWLKFRGVLEFWVKDKSSSFEKTDVLIEKSVHTAFQVINTKPLEHVLDLSKFLVKEILPNK